MSIAKLSVFALLFSFLCSNVFAHDDLIPGIPTPSGSPVNGKSASDLEIGYSFTNELDGYKFFSGGRIDTLRLGVSTKADVDKIFGSDCRHNSEFSSDFCAYDSDWKVTFWYFDKNSGFVRASNGVQSHYLVKPEFIGTIQRITLLPTKRLSIRDAVFSEKFSRNSLSVYNYRMAASDRLRYTAFRDSYGLIYEIFDEILSKSQVDSAFEPGDLIRIRYEFPHRMKDKMFTKQ